MLIFQKWKKKDGYGQSKVVAEKLLFEAKKLFGLKMKIFRPSSISGHSTTGFSNSLDFSNLFLNACIYLGICCETSVNFNWIPVDFVARSVVILSKSQNSGEIFHLAGEGPSLKSILNELKNTGFHLETVTEEEWQKKVENKICIEHTHLFPIKQTLINFRWKPLSSAKSVPTLQTQKVLFDLNIPWINISNEMIVKGIKFFKERLALEFHRIASELYFFVARISVADKYFLHSRQPIAF